MLALRAVFKLPVDPNSLRFDLSFFVFCSFLSKFLVFHQRRMMLILEADNG